MWSILLALAGIAGIPLSLAYRRATKERALREARARADQIRQRLGEQPSVKRSEVEIRLETAEKRK
jgi:hypothetical protein